MRESTSWQELLKKQEWISPSLSPSSWEPCSKSVGVICIVLRTISLYPLRFVDRLTTNFKLWKGGRVEPNALFVSGRVVSTMPLFRLFLPFPLRIGHREKFCGERFLTVRTSEWARRLRCQPSATCVVSFPCLSKTTGPSEMGDWTNSGKKWCYI